MSEDVFDGAKLRTARKRAGLSQRTLGKRAVVSVSAIKYIEAQERIPHWSTAQRLAEAVGVPLADLTTVRFDTDAAPRGAA